MVTVVGLSGKIPAQLVNMALSDVPGIIGEELQWYMFRRFNSVPRHLIQIQHTPLQGHPSPKSCSQPNLVLTMIRVQETFKNLIGKMTDISINEVINPLHVEFLNLSHIIQITSIDEPEMQCNMHLVLCDTRSSRA